jgi:hypothetical protein
MLTGRTLYEAIHHFAHVLSYETTGGGWDIWAGTVGELGPYDYIWANNMDWLGEGIAEYICEFFGIVEYGGHRGAIIREIQANRIPALINVDKVALLGPDWRTRSDVLYYQWAQTIVRFIIERWGYEAVMELHRHPDQFERIFGLTRTQFETQWHNWLRATYGQ